MRDHERFPRARTSDGRGLEILSLFSEAGRDADARAFGPEEYLVAGRGLTVTFSTDDGIAGIEGIREGAYENGTWQPGRRLNGDQSHQGRHLRLPPDGYGVQRVRLYRYS